MLKMRLQRRGKNKYATYRVVIADSRAPIKGRIITDIGSYNPHTNMFAVQQTDVTAWLGKGVQPSATVHNLLVTHKLLQAEKVTIWRPPAVEASAEDSAAQPEATAPAPATPTDTAPTPTA